MPSQSLIPNPESLIPPAKDASRISGMFDAIAERYDFLNHLLSAGLDKRWRRQAIEVLQLTGRETVLDLCTGTADRALRHGGSKRARPWSAWFFRGNAATEGKGTQIWSHWPRYRVGRAMHVHPAARCRVRCPRIGSAFSSRTAPCVACRECACARPGHAGFLNFHCLARRRFAISTLVFPERFALIGRVISKHPARTITA